MAHEILEHDQMISGRNITPWHKLGEVKENFDVWDLHRIMSWEVEKHRLLTDTALQTDSFATVRMPRNQSESPIVLGVGLSQAYKVLQNEELIQIVEPFIESGCALETAGTLKNGQRIWIMLRLAKDLHVGQNDVIQKYIMVSNDHTGRQAARFGLIGIRVVCQNTLNAAEENGGSKLIRVFHQGNVTENMKTVASMLDHVNGKFVNYGIQLDKLTKSGINQNDLKKYIENCFLGAYSERQRDKMTNFLEKTESKVIELFESGAGSDLKEAKGTVYGAYQAVNSYLNHHRDVPLETRLPSLLWGHRANIDKKAMKLAMKLAA